MAGAASEPTASGRPHAAAAAPAVPAVVQQQAGVQPADNLQTSQPATGQTAPLSAPQQMQAASPRQHPVAGHGTSLLGTSQQAPRQSLQASSYTSPALQLEKALPEDLLERLDGFASQADLQDLRTQLDEALGQLNDILQQLASMQSAQAHARSQAGVIPAEARQQGMQPSANVSAGSPIFLPLLNEQSPDASVQQEQQIQNWQQQQQQMTSPRERKIRQVTNIPVQAGLNNPAPSQQSASAQTKAESIDRATSAAPGWEMYNNSLDASQVTPGDQEDMITQRQESIMDDSPTSRQQTLDRTQQNAPRNQAPASARGRAGSFKNQASVQQQQQQQQQPAKFEASMAPGDALQPVGPGTQALLVSSTDLGQEAGKQIPATVQLVAQADSDTHGDRNATTAVTALRAPAAVYEQAPARAPGNVDKTPTAPAGLTSSLANVSNSGQPRIAGQAFVVGQAPGLIQAALIPRPKTGASGASAGEAQDSLTVDQLAASLQTVAGVVHAMALGPPSQVTSANSLVLSELLTLPQSFFFHLRYLCTLLLLLDSVATSGK